MLNHEDIKNEFRQILKENPESFPFIAQFWDIYVDEENLEQVMLEFGKFNAHHIKSVRFYKPFSKIINFVEFK